jgi:hypothetical protein
MSTGRERPGSRLLVREAPQRRQGHPVADRVLVEMILRAAVHPEVGELQFERRKRRGDGHVPVVVTVVVDVVERVVAETRRDRETLIERMTPRELECPGLAFGVTGRGGDRLDLGRVASREEHLVAEADRAGDLGAVVALATRIVGIGVLRQAEVGGEILGHAPVTPGPDIHLEVRTRTRVGIAGRREHADVELLREFDVDRALGGRLAARQREAAKHEIRGAAEAPGDDGGGIRVRHGNGAQRDEQEGSASELHFRDSLRAFLCRAAV